ncbi:hypothetical protein [Ligilactobacillus salivarius]|uniref:hypothetical protein n=1 Tax=Ligilactobacillus salivarius TaxID=1624 RepID=UPI0009DA7D1B|nr:hypothetical protein [Ligilactobacillus salivarius]OQR18817.1 hypothetical protein B6U39_09420 [Ligilactobacillus salivarius]
MKKVLIVILGVINVFLLVLTLVIYPRQIKTTKQAISENNAKIENYQANTKNLTVQGYQKVIQNKVKNIDIDNIENTLRSDYSQAITEAYNAKTEDEYKVKERDIAVKLGSNHLASKVMFQTVIQKINGKDYPKSNGLNSVSVAFGKYDVNTHKLPVNILVDYKPVGEDSSATQQVSSKKVIYSFNYNTKTKLDGTVSFTELVSMAK